MRFEREGGRQQRTYGVEAYLVPEKKNVRNQNAKNLDHLFGNGQFKTPLTSCLASGV
jgi:hypothetical protein